MIFRIKEKLYLHQLGDRTADDIMGFLTLENPTFKDAVKMHRWTGDIPEYLEFFEIEDTTLIVPRGATWDVHQICLGHKERIQMVNDKRSLPPVEFAFDGVLNPLQKNAAAAVKRREFGVLEAGTGAGKTVMALSLISDRRQPALIVVHTQELLHQWLDRIEQFLGIPADQIGIVGAGKRKLGEKITVALVQTLIKVVDDVVPHIGYLIVDEAHRVPAKTFTEVVNSFDCRYMTGLTATPFRRDGLTKALHWTLGPVTGKIEKKDLVSAGHICDAEVIFHETDFLPSLDASEYYSQALSELAADAGRNKLICDTISAHAQGTSLVLSDRKSHCTILHAGLRGLKAEVLTGSTPRKERLQIVDDLRKKKCNCLIATGSLIGEGFDLAEIQNVFLTTPVRFSGRLIQYIGRALRPAPGKARAVIHDFVDVGPVFSNSARARRKTYREQGIAT